MSYILVNWWTATFLLKNRFGNGLYDGIGILDLPENNHYTKT
jgi:hypothetical protein